MAGFANNHNGPLTQLHRVVAVGPEAWKPHEMNALEAALKNLGAERFLSTGCCPSDALKGATWVLLAIDKEKRAHESLLLRQIDLSRGRISLGILCIDSVESLLERYMDRLKGGGVQLVVVRSPCDHGRVPIFPQHRSMMVEDLVAGAPEIARAMVGRQK